MSAQQFPLTLTLTSLSPDMHRLLGTPNEDVWPNVTDLQDWNPGFPTWKRLSLAHRTQGIDQFGLDLLEVGRCCGSHGRDETALLQAVSTTC